MEDSYGCKLNNDVEHFAHILEAVDLAAGEPEAEGLLDGDDEAHMAQTVSALDIIRGQIVPAFQFIVVKDVAHDFL